MTFENSSNTNPELPSEMVVSFQQRLDVLRFKMRDLARDSILEDVKHYFPNELSELETLAVELAGSPVRGGIDSAEYFVSEREGSLFVTGRLERHKNSTNDFAGVFGRIAMIPTDRMGRATDRLCAQIEPLCELGDPALNDYYSQRGRAAELHHPFGNSDEYDDMPVWVAVDSLYPGSFRLIDPSDPSRSELPTPRN